MLSKATIYKNLSQEYQFIFGQILLIIEQEFCKEETLFFEKLFLNFIDLYEGNWPKYQVCQTGYHNLRHAIEVALVSTRMAAGYNIIAKGPKLTVNHYKLTITAALFHDAGYLKDSGDNEGSGGKYTFNHVERSKKIANDYCLTNSWSDNERQLILQIIDTTEFATIPDINSTILDPTGRTLAGIVGTADLIAQMADVNYMKNIHHLFNEFAEAYRIHGITNLQRKGKTIYKSSTEMINQTSQFYENFVVPRLEAFGRKDKYLIAFFGEGRNPYMENITANISGKKDSHHVKWRRIGEILQDFGMVNDEQIDKALVTLKGYHAANHQSEKKNVPFRTRFQAWLNGDKLNKNLGDVLLESKAVDPSFLRCALLDQILPQALVSNLSQQQTSFFLQISILLHNVAKDPWIFEQILEMANDLINCHAGSILLADLDKREMILAVSTIHSHPFTIGSSTPLDKGLAGWVFLHDKPAKVDNIATNNRFDIEFDISSDFTPSSILTVPLHINGSPIGVMEFLNIKQEIFKDEDTVMMTLLANIITSSLNNALSS